MNTSDPKLAQLVQRSKVAYYSGSFLGVLSLLLFVAIFSMWKISYLSTDVFQLPQTGNETIQELLSLNFLAKKNADKVGLEIRLNYNKNEQLNKKVKLRIYPINKLSSSPAAADCSQVGNEVQCAFDSLPGFETKQISLVDNFQKENAKYYADLFLDDQLERQVSAAVQ